MEINGLKITTTGDAKIETLETGFRVYNKSNSGFDGFSIYSPQGKGYSIKYGYMSHINEHNATLRSASLLHDELGHVSTFSETYKRYDKYSNNVIFGVNMAFLQNDFRILGLLDGKEIFNYGSDDIEVIEKSVVPNPTLFAIPWPLIWEGIKIAWNVFSVGFTAWTIYQAVKSEQTVTGHPIYIMGEDGNLHVVGHEITVTYDPIMFPINVNGESYNIDSIQFKYDRKYYKQQDKSFFTFIGEQVTLYNIPYIDIEKISEYE